MAREVPSVIIRKAPPGAAGRAACGGAREVPSVIIRKGSKRNQRNRHAVNTLRHFRRSTTGGMMGGTNPAVPTR